MGSIRSLLKSGGNSSQEESRPASARAEGLIQEFENSEKGWFWETGRDGSLTYISDSVARALGREPGDLIDRPFADLVSTETRRRKRDLGADARLLFVCRTSPSRT